MTAIIEVQIAKQWLENKNTIRFVDCRFDLSDPNWGENAYKHEHIKGSVYADLEKDLSGPVTKHGGRHPLPEISKFKHWLDEAGITNDSTIIAYDQGGAPFAARFWWMMKYVGHKNIFVLNGGFPAAKAIGIPINQDKPNYPPSNYIVQLQKDIYSDVSLVKNIVDKKFKAVLIDSREEGRYKGEFEPIDHKAGHIPGAINLDWQKGIKDGKFLPNSIQKERFKGLSENEEIIVYCGSGVTAAPNVLILNNMGYKNVKLYVGSFSDWISYDENPIDTTK